MTLRKLPVAEIIEDKTSIKSVVSAKAFENLLAETATYLCSHFKVGCNVDIRGDFYVSSPILIAGDIDLSNEYIIAFRNIIEMGGLSKQDSDYTRRLFWSCFNSNNCNNLEALENIINKLLSKYGYDQSWVRGRYLVSVSGIELLLYIIFWNLFLCALNDDIYNEQLPLVIELAHCFKLDEHIMRDLCRGVEYVLSGKKLSSDCDLQCDTVECAKFFLGKEE